MTPVVVRVNDVYLQKEPIGAIEYGPMLFSFQYPDNVVENILFPYIYFDQKVFALVQEKNENLLRIYQEQKNKGDRN